jgi:hypothetical protein
VRRAGIDAHDMWGLAAGEFVQAFARLRVPQLHVPIVTRRNELLSVRCEIDVVHGLGVARECPQKLALVVYVPKRNLRVCRCREEQMTATREESHLCDRLGVVFVRVEELLRYEVLRVAAVASELDAEVYTVRLA